MNRQTNSRRMHIQFLVAAFMAGLTASADADINADVSLSGKPAIPLQQSFEASGSVTGFSIDVDFDSLGSVTQAGDLIIGITAPNGNSVQFGAIRWFCRRHLRLPRCRRLSRFLE